MIAFDGYWENAAIPPYQQALSSFERQNHSLSQCTNNPSILAPSINSSPFKLPQMKASNSSSAISSAGQSVFHKQQRSLSNAYPPAPLSSALSNSYARRERSQSKVDFSKERLKLEKERVALLAGSASTTDAGPRAPYSEWAYGPMQSRKEGGTLAQIFDDGSSITRRYLSTEKMTHEVREHT